MSVILPFPAPHAPWPEEAAALAPAERAVLHALRLGAAAFRRGEDAVPALTAAMAERGVPRDAARSVDALLAVAARAVRRPLDLRCPGCPGVSEDEARFLHAAALAQRGAAEGAEDALRAVLTDVGASFALGPLEGLGALLASAGRRLPARRSPESEERGRRGAIEAWTPPADAAHRRH